MGCGGEKIRWCTKQKKYKRKKKQLKTKKSKPNSKPWILFIRLSLFLQRTYPFFFFPQFIHVFKKKKINIWVSV